MMSFYQLVSYSQHNVLDNWYLNFLFMVEYTCIFTSLQNTWEDKFKGDVSLKMCFKINTDETNFLTYFFFSPTVCTYSYLIG